MAVTEHKGLMGRVKPIKIKRGNAVTTWGNAARRQTELKPLIGRLSDKLQAAKGSYVEL
ncbi:hypothetical protein F444_11673 [Phytophthora nicotianae P1976]|uniref:Uncharacterized protein n=1 Tax=Phytophthora nicotianae P1976 TaxID=1317066 RepID=A0A080ZZP1_PHYNI|nr:hypothetical protein F444_11673 [Phytophthora nicotianae P1976]